MKWSACLEKAILWLWYNRNIFAYLLLPLAIVFYLLSSLRKYLYQHDILKKTAISVPVIVVGNITVGGSGKTPLVIWLAHFLQQQGYRPGIISRGYGGKMVKIPCQVTAYSDPVAVGDEPVILAKRSGCPVAVAAKRSAAAQLLLATTDCNIIISDDGLQHYALSRQVEIVVIDGQRGLGNGLLLPAGPLRETVNRLKAIDLVVVNGKTAGPDHFAMQLVPQTFVNVCDASLQYTLIEFNGRRAHAVAGIGNPTRFFHQLTQLGLDIIEHPFPDHYQFTDKDLDFAKDGLPIIMTEKDAIKCQAFATADYWYLPVTPLLPTEFGMLLLTKLQETV